MGQQYELAAVDSIKPGQMQRFVINNQAILLANVDNNYYAIEDLCSHEDALLSRGAIKERCVECPLHGSRFDLKTGLPKEEPATEPVRTFQLQVRDKKIYISLGED